MYYTSMHNSCQVLIGTLNNSMRILITGCNGFIAKNMIEWMSQEYFWEIEQWSWDPYNYPDIKRYNWVIHLGAITDTSDSDVDTIIHQNLEFSQWLFNECNKHKVNLQYASSWEVYGRNNNYNEYAPCHPESPYAWSKYLFDRWVFQQPHHISVHGFRYFNVYGKYMYTKGSRTDIMYKWREQAKHEGKITICKNAEFIKRDWVWVGDICKLHIDFIKSVHGSGIWNVGTGLSHSYLDVAEEIALQEDVPIEFTDEILSEQYTAKADLKLLKSTIGKRKWLNVYEWIDRRLG